MVLLQGPEVIAQLMGGDDPTAAVTDNPDFERSDELFQNNGSMNLIRWVQNVEDAIAIYNKMNQS